MPHARSPWPPDEVRVSYARTADLARPDRTARALAWLASTERERYDRFRGSDDRMMFLLGRVMARALVGHAIDVAPDGWRWREGPRGRPEIAEPHTPLRFNLAHSAGLVVCALATGRDIGVDVEDRLRRPVDRDLVRRYCAPLEVADVERQGDAWHDRFLLYWTLKEAYLKARGLGIAVQLADIAFALDPAPRVSFAGSLAGTDARWHFHVAQPTDRHLLAVAASASVGAAPEFTIEPFDWSVTSR